MRRDYLLWVAFNTVVFFTKQQYLRPNYIAGYGCRVVKFDNGIQIETCPNVYPPSEDTRLLLSAIQASKGQRVLEMGTGTGIIALHCANAGCLVTAVDISLDAVKCTRKNAELNSMDIEIIQSDLFESIKGKYDIIILNPPYLSGQDSENLTPQDALPLIGGEKGHEISLLFLDQAHNFLNHGGKIYLLTSSESEAALLEASSNRFSMKTIAEQRIFFEVLAVLELQLDKC
ncbi:MAG: methyltransferase [Thermoplasmata archaeon]|nr:methyltransferase [Thermoplasmata archaeon]